MRIKVEVELKDDTIMEAWAEAHWTPADPSVGYFKSFINEIILYTDEYGDEELDDRDLKDGEYENIERIVENHDYEEWDRGWYDIEELRYRR